MHVHSVEWARAVMDNRRSFTKAPQPMGKRVAYEPMSRLMSES